MYCRYGGAKHTSNRSTGEGRDAIVTAFKHIHASYTKKEQRPTQQTRQKGWYDMNIYGQQASHDCCITITMLKNVYPVW